MYRVRSTDLWYNAPGIVAAYQPVAAPDPFAARQNVSNDARQAGVYAAQQVGAPVWTGALGWSGFGAGNYLATGITPSATHSMIVSFAGGSGTVWAEVAGSVGTTSTRFRLAPTYVLDTAKRGYHFGAANQAGGARAYAGVLALTPGQGYYNGIADHAPFTVSWSGTPTAIFIGTYNNNGTPASGNYWTGSIGACAISACQLSAAAIWQYSRQMAYCHFNPDWSAWGRRRRYYYAPSAAATFQVAWARNANNVQQVAR